MAEAKSNFRDVPTNSADKIAKGKGFGSAHIFTQAICSTVNLQNE
jgi:hypothetical protein